MTEVGDNEGSQEAVDICLLKMPFGRVLGFLGDLKFCSPPSFQLSMKGPPGPVGLTGRPGPVVSKESVWRRGDTSVEGGTSLQLHYLISLSSKGLPGYPGQKGEMGEMGPQVRLVGMGKGLDGKGLLPEPQDKVLFEDNDKGAEDTFAITALPRE